jgi:hypothetical protein
VRPLAQLDHTDACHHLMELRSEAIQRDAAQNGEQVVALAFDRGQKRLAGFEDGVKDSGDGEAREKKCGALVAIGDQMTERPKRDADGHGVSDTVAPRAAEQEDANKYETHKAQREIGMGSVMRGRIKRYRINLAESPENSGKQEKRQDAINGPVGLAEALSGMCRPGGDGGIQVDDGEDEDQRGEQDHSAHQPHAEYIRVEAQQERGIEHHANNDRDDV